MTTSDGNGDWNLDAVGNSGHRCTKCGSRKHGASMCDADLTQVDVSSARNLVTGKTKGKSKGKAKGKGFGKKGKMNELGYAEETDGMDEWYQDDGSWWSDQTWLQKPGVTGMRVGQLTGLTDSGQRIGPGLVKNHSKNMQAVVSDPRTVKFSHWF